MMHHNNTSTLTFDQEHFTERTFARDDGVSELGDDFEMKTYSANSLHTTNGASHPNVVQQRRQQKVDYDSKLDPNAADVMDLGEGKADGAGLEDDKIQKKKKSMTQTLITFPYWTILVVVAEITIFAAMCIVGKGIDDPLNNPMIGPKEEYVIQFGAKKNDLMKSNGLQFWRFFVFMFIHQSVLVLLFNLMWLLTTVRKIESVWTAPRMAIIYMLSGIGGGVLSSVFRFDLITTGSTSCIVGIIAASLAELILNWDVVFNPLKILFSVIVQILVFLVIGLLPTVDQFAHIGGLVCGFLSGVMICSRTQKKELEKKWVKIAVLIARVIAAILLVIYFALFFAIFYGAIPFNCSACYWLNPTYAMYLGDDDL